MTANDHYYDADMARNQARLALTPDMAAQRRRMLECLDLQPGETVLDIGCGNGFFARDIAAIIGPSGKVFGTDGSSAMVNMARDICPDGEFRACDATEQPFDDGMFDAVTATQVLCYVSDPENAIREMYRLLRPGGRLVIMDTDWQSVVWNAADGDLMRRAIALVTSDYENAHVPRTLSSDLNAGGFAEIERSVFTILNWDQNSDGYSTVMARSIRQLAEHSDSFGGSDLALWEADQSERIATGTYMFSLNRYIFKAVRPGDCTIRNAP